MEAKIYNQIGKEAGTIKLPENIFGLPWKESVVHQVAVAMMGNARNPIAHTKTRGEVAGSGIKPWKQKGTGRARHGSRRSPIWVGGGISGGPRNDKNFSRKINKKTKVKALFTALSKKFKDGEIVFLSDLTMRNPKTKEAKNVITSISKIKEFGGIARRNNAAFVTLCGKNEETERSFKNFSNLELGLLKDLNVLDLLQYKYLIITEPEKAVAALSAKLK
jgi:large subunit ribosomal protein L4